MLTGIEGLAAMAAAHNEFKLDRINKSIDKLNELFSTMMEYNDDPEDLVRETFQKIMAKNIWKDYKIEEFDLENMSCTASFGEDGMSIKTYAKPMGNDEYEICSEIIDTYKHRRPNVKIG